MHKGGLLFFTFFFSTLVFGVPSKVLVTGATGFVGSHIVQMLLHQGAQVTVLVRDAKKLDPSLNGHVQVIEGDITTYADVERAVQGVNAVIHAAAFVSDFSLNKDTWDKVNVGGTKNIVDAVLKKSLRDSWDQKIRLVYISSVDALDISTHQVKEDTSYAIKSPYSYPRTKALAEQYVFETYQKAQLAGNKYFQVTAVRPTWVFGPGDTHFIPGIISALKNKTPVFIGSPDKKIHLTYIDNLMDSVLLLLTRSEAVGKAFIHNDGPRTWASLIKQIEDYTHLEHNRWLESIPFSCGMLLGAIMQTSVSVMHSQSRPDLTPFAVKYLFSDISYSSDLLKSTFNYTPSTPIEEGLITTLQSLKNY